MSKRASEMLNLAAVRETLMVIESSRSRMVREDSSGVGHCMVRAVAELSYGRGGMVTKPYLYHVLLFPKVQGVV